MDILYLLVPLSVVLVFVVGAVLWMAVDGGQFDDLDGPALKVIADDDTPGTHQGRSGDAAGTQRGASPGRSS